MDVIEDSNSLNQADLLADKIIKFSRTLYWKSAFSRAAIHQLIIQRRIGWIRLPDGRFFFVWHLK